MMKKIIIAILFVVTLSSVTCINSVSSDKDVLDNVKLTPDWVEMEPAMNNSVDVCFWTEAE